MGLGAIGAPILATIVYLDSRAGKKRQDLFDKVNNEAEGLREQIKAIKSELYKEIDHLRRTVEEHDQRTGQRLGNMETRLAVIEDRSHRIRLGDMLVKRQQQETGKEDD